MKHLVKYFKVATRDKDAKRSKTSCRILQTPQQGSVWLSRAQQVSKVSWMNWQDDVTSPKSDRLHSVLKRSLFTKRLFC